MLVVLFKYSTTAALYHTHIVGPYWNTRDAAVMSNTNGAFTILTRETTWNGNGISFSDCYKFTSISNGTQDNSMMIPVKVVGFY